MLELGVTDVADEEGEWHNFQRINIYLFVVFTHINEQKLFIRKLPIVRNLTVKLWNCITLYLLFFLLIYNVFEVAFFSPLSPDEIGFTEVILFPFNPPIPLFDSILNYSPIITKTDVKLQALELIFRGWWDELRLGVEFNVAGFLRVL